MKDALGHGSNPHKLGANRSMIGHVTSNEEAARQLASGPKSRKPLMRVEKQVAFSGRTAAGQRVTNVGSVWQKVHAGKGKRRAVAERIAMNARIDNPNSLIRIR